MDSQIVVVGVLGARGAGKSAYLRLVTGRSAIQVGKATSDIQAYGFAHDGVIYLLIDTPGFDENTSESSVTRNLTKWLDDTLGPGEKLDGALYFHSVPSNYIFSSRSSNLIKIEERRKRLLRQLVGYYPALPDGASAPHRPQKAPRDRQWENTILITTGGAELPSSLRATERQSLYEDLGWAAAIRRGASVAKLAEGDRKMALSFLEVIGRNVLGEENEDVDQEDLSADEWTTSRFSERKTETLDQVAARMDPGKLAADLQAKEKRAKERARLSAEKQVKDLDARLLEAIKRAERMERNTERERVAIAMWEGEQERERQREERRTGQRVHKQDQRQRERIQKQIEAVAAQRAAEAKPSRRSSSSEDETLDHDEAAEREPRASPPVNRAQRWQRCRAHFRATGRCSKCNCKLWYQWFCMHCCFCDEDSYVVCPGCGPRCRNASHPPMRKMEIPQDPCILM